jgi:hypothetical protein
MSEEFRFPKDMHYSDYIKALGKPKKQIQKSPYSSSSTANLSTGYYTFEIEGQQANIFVDSGSIYFYFKVANTDGEIASFPAHLGAYSLISKIIIETSTGVKITEIADYNNLMCIKIDESADLAWLMANKLSLGTDATWKSATTATGTGTPAAATYTTATTIDHHLGLSLVATTGTNYFCLPIQLGLLANSSYLPVEGVEGIRFKIYFDNAVTAMIGNGADGPSNTEITISEPLLVYDIVELSDQEASALREANKYKYVLTGSDYQNQTATFLATAGTYSNSIVMGFSKRLAKRIYGSFRTSASLTTFTQNANSFSRNKINLTDIALLYNGSKVKDQSLTIDANSAMVWAENRKASHGIMNMLAPALNSTNFNLEEPSGVSSALQGQFYFVLDLTNGLQLEDGRVISGLNVQTGNFSIQFRGSHATNAIVASQQLDLYLEFENKMELDVSPGGSRRWEISN